MAMKVALIAVWVSFIVFGVVYLYYLISTKGYWREVEEIERLNHEHDEKLDPLDRLSFADELERDSLEWPLTEDAVIRLQDRISRLRG